MSLENDHDLASAVRAVLANAPTWVRNELSAKDLTARARAEETLAAMIAAALRGPPSD